MEPTLPKEEKVLDQSQATDSNKIVDFANLLLAKHEANMRKREQEGLYSPLNNKQSEVSSSPGVAQGVQLFKDVISTSGKDPTRMNQVLD